MTHKKDIGKDKEISELKKEIADLKKQLAEARDKDQNILCRDCEHRIPAEKGMTECPEEGDEIWVKGKVKSYRKDTKKVWVEVQGHIGTRDDNWFEEGQYSLGTCSLCHGTGQSDKGICPQCKNGTGKITHEGGK